MYCTGCSLHIYWNIVWYCVARVFFFPQLCEVATHSWQKTQLDSTHQLVSLPQKLTKDHSLPMPSNCWWALGVTVFLSAKDLAVLNTGAKVRTISDTNAMISEHQNQSKSPWKWPIEMIALFKFTSNQNNDAGQGTTSCASVPLVFKLDQHWSTHNPSLGLVLCFCFGLIEVWINDWGVALQFEHIWNGFITCDAFWQVTLPMNCRGAPDPPDMSEITARAGWLWTTPSSTWVRHE